jgi:probable HAF family extracellular repeat protein
MRIMPLLAQVSCAAILAASAHADSGYRYRITSITTTDLGTLGGEESHASDINDFGSVVGWSRIRTGVRHAFILRSGVMTDLIPDSATMSEANGINNSARVVGTVFDNRDRQDHAFHWDASTPLTFTLLDEHLDYDIQCRPASIAKAINDSGNISGSMVLDCPGDSGSWAVRWLSPLHPWQGLGPAAPYYPHAEDINQESAIILDTWGGALTNGSQLYTDSGIEHIASPSLPAGDWYFYNNAKTALGLNDSRGVVGHVNVCHTAYPRCDSFYRQAFHTTGPLASSLLPKFPESIHSSAREVNNQGFAVGWAQRAHPKDGTLRHVAVIWHAHLGIVQLPMPAGADILRVPPYDFCEANSVNGWVSKGARVQVVGFCVIADKRRAIRWDITVPFVYVPPPVGPRP